MSSVRWSTTPSARKVFGPCFASLRGVGPSTVTVTKRTMKCKCVGKTSWRKCLPSSFGGLFEPSRPRLEDKLNARLVCSDGSYRLALEVAEARAIECRRAGAAAGAGGGFGLGLGGGGLTTSAVGRESSGSGEDQPRAALASSLRT